MTAAETIGFAGTERARRERFGVFAGAFFLGGAAQFFLLNTIAESLYQNYSVRDQALSELGVGQIAWIWNTSLFLIGLTVMFGGYFMYRSVGSRLTSILAFILVIGCVGASLVPMDSPIGIHGIFALLAFAGGGLFTLTSYRVIAGR